MKAHYVFNWLNDNRKKIALSTFILVLSSPLNAGWTVLNSPNTNDLKAIDFPIDQNTGYAVGNNGTILKTDDAGSNWENSNSGVKDHLQDIDFINNSTGYAVGTNGTILKTHDGGLHWSRLDSGTTRHLYSIHFPVDEFTGYAGGDVSTLLKTTDGGLSWKIQSIAGGYVRDIVFPRNNNTGFASAIYGTLGFIYKTQDGGNNWFKVLILDDAFIESMSFPEDEFTGYIANHDNYSQHGIWKTVDGGANWNYISQGITSVPVAINFPQDTQYGLAVGLSGDVISTSNGGVSWSEGNVGINKRLADLDLIDSSTGYAVGSGGVIIKTTDGGRAAVKSFYLHPSSMGSINTFSTMNACSSDWDCVNDQASNLGTGLPETVNSRDFLADANGNRVMLSLDDGAITDNQQVTKICVSLAATQFNGPYASLSYQRLGIDSSPVDTLPFWVGNYWYNGIRTHCWSNLSWTASELDSLEIGVKTVSGQYLEAAQLYVKVYTSPR